MNHLKGVENNLKIKNDSNLKKKQDNKELISKLNNTIKQLNVEISSLKEKSKINNKKNKTTANYLNIYDQNILSLNNKIKSMDYEKNQYLQENATLNIELKTKKFDNNKEAVEKELKLKEELNKIKTENENLKNKIGDKEIKLQNLKEYHDKVQEIAQKGNFQEEIKQFNIEEILAENDLDSDNMDYSGNIEDKKYGIEIKKALNENKNKQNEINEQKKYFQNIILKKDGIINALESQINPSLIKGQNQINNNYTNEEDMNNHINNKGFSSLKELNLDSENMYYNNKINNINSKNQENYEENMGSGDDYNMNENEENFEPYNQEGEDQYMNEEIQDLGDLGENEGEEELNNEYQDEEYNQYLQQHPNGEEDNEYNEGQMNEEIEEEGEEQVEYMGDINDMNYDNEEGDDYDNNGLEIKDLDI